MLTRFPLPEPHVVGELQVVRPAPLQTCGVTAWEIEFASQISISAQQAPSLPVPEFWSVGLATQPSLLACGKLFSWKVQRTKMVDGNIPLH